MFKLIRDIDINDPDTWKEGIFLTCDIDWASDDVLQFVLDLFAEHNANVTFFATHKTKVLSELKSGHEVGIHPNFNFLLNGDSRYGKNYKEVTTHYKSMYPEAVSVRSHSLTQNSLILDEFFSQGLTYDLNHFLPLDKNISLKPFKLLSQGITKIPYFWEDDIYFMNGHEWNIRDYLKRKGLKVFDFHPIHIFLNIDKFERYKDAKPYLQDYTKLKNYIYTSSFGTRDILIQILERGNSI